MEVRINTELIKNYINGNKLSKSFCRKCRISSTALTKEFNTECNLSIIALFKVARVLGIGISELINI